MVGGYTHGRPIVSGMAVRGGIVPAGAGVSVE
jgi:hypothetical protein